jgi:hypothetical protein
VPIELDKDTLDGIKKTADFLANWRLGKIPDFKDGEWTYEGQLFMLIQSFALITPKLEPDMPGEASRLDSKLGKFLEKAIEVDDLNRNQKGSEIAQRSKFELINMSIELGTRLRQIVEMASGPDQAKDEQPKELSRTYEKAYQSYQLGKQELGDLATDKEIHEWLKKNGHEEYRLPAYDTWVRYVRKGREFYKTHKNKPRAGRSDGMPKARDIESLSSITNQFGNKPD